MAAKTTSVKDDVPADANIPDNYVSHTLKTTKSLPPVTLKNFTRELNWLNVFILIVMPIVGFVLAYSTKLKWQTALWAVIYYYMTGLGEVSCWTCSRGVVSDTRFQESRRGIIDYGLIVHTMRLPLSNMRSQCLAPAPFRVPLSGGQGAIGLTIVTPTPSWTHIVLTKVCLAYLFLRLLINTLSSQRSILLPHWVDVDQAPPKARCG